MKLENQVITLEQAKQLEELGVVQSSLFWWKCNSEQDAVICGCTKAANERYFGLNTWYAAFTVAELGIMLPSENYSRRDGSEDSKYGNWEWVDDCYEAGFGGYATEAIARCENLLRHLKNGYVKVKEINKRLAAA